ncbi:YeeE/YedE family protein, partial [Dehalococcoidia bacterium]|nr:YeeE/YedE family protein [Dehalococcoidia bacterium]
YGARIAGGCNIGALFSGITTLSLSGWVFAVFLFLGAIVGSKMLVKFFIV